MSKKRIWLLISGLILIITPFFINIYSIYRLISLAIGIILIDVYLATNQKINIFLLLYLPILLIIFTYSIDYIKTYTLNLKPIYVLENKINSDVSLYNSLFYRIYKCGNNYVFDNEYQKDFVCDTQLIQNIDVNKFLNSAADSYKKYHHDFIKVTGKISKISGTSSVELKEYTVKDNSINGYVNFIDTHKLVAKLNDVNLTGYKIYDYITVVGLLDSYDKDSGTLTLINAKLEANNLYDDYEMQIIEGECSNSIKEYTDNLYTKCVSNVYLDYKIDKYELSYAIKDGKVILDSILAQGEKELKDGKILYKLPKFNILSCNREQNIILSQNEKVDYTLCDE